MDLLPEDFNASALIGLMTSVLAGLALLIQKWIKERPYWGSLKYLNEVTEELREEIRQERAENRQLRDDYDTLRDHVTGVEMAMARILVWIRMQGIELPEELAQVAKRQTNSDQTKRA